MGGSLSSSAKQLASKVAPPRKLKPLSSDEISALNRLAEQEQARLRELPSMEELNSKDITLDELLNKLGGSIAGRDLSPDEPSEGASSSGRPLVQMPPARPPQALRAAEAASWRSTAQSADDQPGRLQSYLIREILEARTAAAARQERLDLEPYVRMYGADRTKLLTLMEYTCLPEVAKVATFGHQYAFGRAPHWWLKGGVSGAQFLSEPDELRRRLMGNPVGAAAAGGEGDAQEAPTAMFRGKGAAAGGSSGGGAEPAGSGAGVSGEGLDAARGTTGSGTGEDGGRVAGSGAGGVSGTGQVAAGGGEGTAASRR